MHDLDVDAARVLFIYKSFCQMGQRILKPPC